MVSVEPNAVNILVIPHTVAHVDLDSTIQDMYPRQSARRLLQAMNFR